MVYYITIVILSIIIHEFGHLFASLYFKVNVKAFSLGFGPILLHKKWKGIDWRLSLIPLGGYCDIEESLDIKNSLSNIAYWKQFIILMAGVFLNLSIAFIVYLIQFQSIYVGIYIDILLMKLLLIGDYMSITLLFEMLNINIYLIQISFLNLFLFITNILPIPALDGGYLWMLPLRRRMGELVFKLLIYGCFSLLIIGQLILIYYWWIV